MYISYTIVRVNTFNLFVHQHDIYWRMKYGFKGGKYA